MNLQKTDPNNPHLPIPPQQGSLIMDIEEQKNPPLLNSENQLLSGERINVPDRPSMNFQSQNRKQSEMQIEHQQKYPSIQQMVEEKAEYKKQQKSKKPKLKLIMTDFTSFLPEGLINLNKSLIPSKIRKGQRYQAHVDPQPHFSMLQRPMRHWLVWQGSREDKTHFNNYLQFFKDNLGENRTEEEMIHLRDRFGLSHWDEVKDYIEQNRQDLRRFYMNQQRGRI